jgi:hypothetical protein
MNLLDLLELLIGACVGAGLLMLIAMLSSQRSSTFNADSEALAALDAEYKSWIQTESRTFFGATVQAKTDRDIADARDRLRAGLALAKNAHADVEKIISEHLGK